MKIIGMFLVIIAFADFVLSLAGINLTPFLPKEIAKFSPLIIGLIGYAFLRGADPELEESDKNASWRKDSRFKSSSYDETKDKKK